ncbi:hypothetical protein C8046_06395 [Serinibacter arcticus]|uniref:DUF559 domain-containing protein n=1 Tax=Serinibacter arcticus TaxID=1655435 RepID=A0A2U1ZTM0_9MICO|nr:hypothetical protein [Serinibacter arcticus]PWD50339.1 hypothetical protein C8046_06395 [Serinibacter arcticus]
MTDERLTTPFERTADRPAVPPPAWHDRDAPRRGYPVLTPTLPSLVRFRGCWAGRIEAVRSELIGVRRGVFVTAGDAAPDPELLAIAAVEKRLTTEYAFSHRTAARLSGLWVPPWDGSVHITQGAKPAGQGRGDRTLVRHHVDLPDGDLRTVSGLVVTSLELTAVDCARDLTCVQALPVVDSALLVGADKDVMQARLAGSVGGRGVRAARETVDLATGRIGSPAESRVRARVVMDGLPRPQTLIRVATPDGPLEVDLGWEEVKVGIEVHGRGKYSSGADPFDEAVRRERLFDVGWAILDVRTDQRSADYLARTRTALRRRGGLA